MDPVTLAVQLISGALGGNIAGSLLKNYNLGFLGNSLAGLVGGGVGAHLLSQVLGVETPPISLDSIDPQAILAQVGSGGAGGAVLMVIIGLLKSLFAKG